ncbi:hypothetical protein ABPG72_020409 [Tetrahymena utriculariae]
MSNQKPLKFYENRGIINIEARFPPNQCNNEFEQFQFELLKKHNYEQNVNQKNNDYLNNSYDQQQQQQSAAATQNQYFSQKNLKTHNGFDNHQQLQSQYKSQQQLQQNELFQNQNKLNTDFPEITVNRQLANPRSQNSPSKIFQQKNNVDKFLTPVSNQQGKFLDSPSKNGQQLSATNKSSHKPIFSSSIVNSQAFNEVDVSEINQQNQENDQVKHSKKYHVPPYQNNKQEQLQEERVKRSHNSNMNSQFFSSPTKTGITNKKIFNGETNNEELNKSQSYVKNIELLNSEEKIKKSKIFQSVEQSQHAQQQLQQQHKQSYIEGSQNKVQDKYSREKALREQELKKITLEQAFCQNCFEFIRYETVDIVEFHSQNCKSIEDQARIQVYQFIKKEKELHNSFIEEADHSVIENQQLIQILNSKLEKLRYIFMKMTNILQDSDFLQAKPELKVYNIVEIKKSIEKICHQDEDCRFIQSCLENIKNQTKDIDLIQQIYCTPESTQFLQIINTVPEIAQKKMDYITKLHQQNVF